MRARDLVGTGQRIATLLVKIRGRFRANPLLHADNWLGVGTGNILWSNYETKYYYFPVQLRPEIASPEPSDFELVAVRSGEDARRKWEQILSDHVASIDKMLVWNGDPDLDAITRAVVRGNRAARRNPGLQSQKAARGSSRGSVILRWSGHIFGRAQLFFFSSKR